MKVALVLVGNVEIDLRIEEVSKRLGIELRVEKVNLVMNEIAEKIYSLSSDGFDLVFTVGGVGIGEHDIVPEATEMVIDRKVTGLELFILNEIVSKGEILTRIVSGIRKRTIVVNLPQKDHVELLEKVVKSITYDRI